MHPASQDVALVTAEEIKALQRENAFLKQRCALLEADVSDLEAQATRLGQQLERFMERRETHIGRPNPLSGGQ